MSIKRDERFAAGEIQWSGLALHQRADDGTRDPAVLLLGDNGERGKLARAIPMRLDLTDADDVPVLFGDNKMPPLQIHWVDVGCVDHLFDGGLVG